MVNIEISDKANYEDSKLPIDGRIHACKKCSGLECCGVLEEGGSLEPPYLTRQDIQLIEYHTGFSKKQFAVQRVNPVTGNKIYTMKVTPNYGCIFFDFNKGNCGIHSFRPMDCRLFPLDIRFIDNSYYWALFKYKHCNLSPRDIDILLKYKDVALTMLGNELHDYSTYPIPGMTKIGYQLIMNLTC